MKKNVRLVIILVCLALCIVLAFFWIISGNPKSPKIGNANRIEKTSFYDERTMEYQDRLLHAKEKIRNILHLQVATDYIQGDSYYCIDIEDNCYAVSLINSSDLEDYLADGNGEIVFDAKAMGDENEIFIHCAWIKK